MIKGSRNRTGRRWRSIRGTLLMYQSLNERWQGCRLISWLSCWRPLNIKQTSNIDPLVLADKHEKSQHVLGRLSKKKCTQSMDLKVACTPYFQTTFQDNEERLSCNNCTNFQTASRKWHKLSTFNEGYSDDRSCTVDQSLYFFVFVYCLCLSLSFSLSLSMMKVTEMLPVALDHCSIKKPWKEIFWWIRVINYYFPFSEFLWIHKFLGVFLVW